MTARIVPFLLALFTLPSPAPAESHASWPEYIKAVRLECPGPFDTLDVPRELILGGKTYKHEGYRLEVIGGDSDGDLNIGVLGAIKDATEGTRKNLKQALAWFKSQGVEWLVANGDLALDAFELEEVMTLLGDSGFPVLMIPGNSESHGSWARTYGRLHEKYPNLINGAWVRQLIIDDAELWTVPGYYDRAFVHQGAACRYKEEDLQAMRKALTPKGDRPQVLISHGPPKGQGKKALDRIFDGQNVGDSKLTEFLKRTDIPFGIFGHILEAGGRGVGKDQKTAVRPGKASTRLYVNAGALCGSPWGMLDGSTSFGMAMIFSLQKGKKGVSASYTTKRFAATPMD